MRLFRTKSLAQFQAEAKQTHLAKTLTAFDLVMLGLGAIIGVGVFVLTGVAASLYSGPAITLSFALGGLTCIFTAFTYTELASAIPVAGGAYAYMYVVLGEIIAWMVGWTTLMITTFGGATVAAGWSGYIQGALAIVGVHLPKSIGAIPANGGVVNLPAIFISLIIGLTLIRSTRAATALNSVLVIVKLAVILGFVIVAAPHFTFLHWENYAPNGFSGIALGAGVIFTAFTGFDAVANAAEECKNPKRDLPWGIIGSITGAVIIYVIISGLLTGLVPYHELNNPEPLSYALRAHGSSVGSARVATGAIAGMSSVLLMMIFGQSRIAMSLARDGMWPKFISNISRHSTPHVAIIIATTVISLLSGFLPLATIGAVTSLATLASLFAVSIAVMVLRYKRPEMHRPFRCPAVYLVASVSAISCGYLAIKLFLEDIWPFTICFVIGLVIYAVYGYWHSNVVEQPEA